MSKIGGGGRSLVQTSKIGGGGRSLDVIEAYATCPECGATISMGDVNPGDQVTCDNCQIEFTVGNVTSSIVLYQSEQQCPNCLGIFVHPDNEVVEVCPLCNQIL